MTKDEAMKLALEAFGWTDEWRPAGLKDEAIAALREALNEPVQEPVAHQYQDREGVWKDFINEKHYKDTMKDGSWPIRSLYTAPPRREWVSLTDADWDEVANMPDAFDQGVAWAQARLKEKNCGS